MLPRIGINKSLVLYYFRLLKKNYVEHEHPYLLFKLKDLDTILYISLSNILPGLLLLLLLINICFIYLQLLPNTYKKEPSTSKASIGYSTDIGLLTI